MEYELGSISLFEGLEPGTLIKIVQDLGGVCSYSIGAILMTPGESEKTVFFIMQGKVRLNLLSPDGDVISYREIIAHDYFGWLSAMDNGERLTSAVVLEPAKILTVSAERFRRLLLSDSRIHQNFMNRVGGVIRRYTERIQELSLLSAQQRIVHELARQFKASNQPIAIASHEDFATWAGTSRETVTRTLNLLEKSGFIRKVGTQYQLLKKMDTPENWLSG